MGGEPAKPGRCRVVGGEVDVSDWRESPPSWGVLTLCTALAAVLGGGISGVIAHHHDTDSTGPAPQTVTLGGTAAASTPAVPGLVPGSEASVAARILPSVVSIEVRTGSGGDTGSGIVISESGYILTNNHVVADAASGGRLTVVFPDKQRVHGDIVGRDRVSDLAVVQVHRVHGLRAATLG